MFMLDETFSVGSSLSETEEIMLYYISGYVALEEDITVLDPTDAKKHFPSSESTILTCHVKLL